MSATSKKILTFVALTFALSTPQYDLIATAESIEQARLPYVTVTTNPCTIPAGSLR